MERWMRTRKVSEEEKNENKARTRTMNKRRQYIREKKGKVRRKINRMKGGEAM
jgi:hypothetical protein